MDLNKVELGKKCPDEFNVVIEVAGGSNVKYEFDKDSGALMVDRFLHTAMFYPASYGFLPHTLEVQIVLLLLFLYIFVYSVIRAQEATYYFKIRFPYSA